MWGSGEFIVSSFDLANDKFVGGEMIIYLCELKICLFIIQQPLDQTIENFHITNGLGGLTTHQLPDKSIDVAERAR